MKIVIIGAGSTVFTPGLIADLTGSTLFADATVALVDINPRSAETMARYAERVARERGVGLRVEYATDRREVLAGADFVTVTIAVGGARAWERDVRIPEAHGVYQTVGDSVGPGGVFRALRHVPELVAIARDMEELCPDAWLFNYTNPLTALVRAVHKSSSDQVRWALPRRAAHARGHRARSRSRPGRAQPDRGRDQSPGLGARPPPRRTRTSTPASESWSAVGWPHRRHRPTIRTRDFRR